MQGTNCFIMENRKKKKKKGTIIKAKIQVGQIFDRKITTKLRFLTYLYI